MAEFAEYYEMEGANWDPESAIQEAMKSSDCPWRGRRKERTVTISREEAVRIVRPEMERRAAAIRETILERNFESFYSLYMVNACITDLIVFRILEYGALDFLTIVHRAGVNDKDLLERVQEYYAEHRDTIDPLVYGELLEELAIDRSRTFDHIVPFYGPRMEDTVPLPDMAEFQYTKNSDGYLCRHFYKDFEDDARRDAIKSRHATMSAKLMEYIESNNSAMLLQWYRDGLVNPWLLLRLLWLGKLDLIFEMHRRGGMYLVNFKHNVRLFLERASRTAETYEKAEAIIAEFEIERPDIGPGAIWSH